MSVLHGAPLCPAGHLPHEGGDRALIAGLANVQSKRAGGKTANLPPRGGDVRQDRGGREGMPACERS
jgi:hypothetical protein